MAVAMPEESERGLPPGSPWWVDLAREASADAVPIEGERVEVFARKCYRLFFQQEMGKEMYFQCCCLAWMVQCLDRGATAAKLWEATQMTLQVSGEDDACITGWILPKLHLEDLGTSSTTATVSTEDSAEEQYIHLLIQLWKRFYKACEEPLPIRPSKRQRTTYHYYSSSASTSTLDDLMKGSYKLPAVVLWSNVILNCGIDSWQALHEEVHLLPRIFKTLTAEDIQAALAVVGMQCLIQGQSIPGLTPCILLDKYLTRTGYVESV